MNSNNVLPASLPWKFSKSKFSYLDLSAGEILLHTWDKFCLGMKGVLELTLAVFSFSIK